MLIRINGQMRRRLEELTTKLLLGYAVIAKEQVERGKNRIEVELLSKNQKASIALECEGEAYLEVWFRDGQLTLHTPAEPPAYL